MIGEVKYPGQYIVKDREERLADIIKRSGGLRPSAFTKGAKIMRKGELISIDFQNAINNENMLRILQFKPTGCWKTHHLPFGKQPKVISIRILHCKR